MSEPQLSPRLTWARFSATKHLAHAADQAGNTVVYTYARLWARDVWEPLLDLWRGGTLTSGYRSPLLNAAVGGSPNSAHVEGRAGDVLPPPALGLIEAFEMLLASPSVRFDKAILETDGKKHWIHIQIARTSAARRVALMTFDRRNFELFNPDDPRVSALDIA